MLKSFNIPQAYTKERQELSWNNLAHDTKLPLTHSEPMTIKFTLLDRMLVTNPEEFTDESGEEYDTKLLEDNTTS